MDRDAILQAAALETDAPEQASPPAAAKPVVDLRQPVAAPADAPRVAPAAAAAPAASASAPAKRQNRPKAEAKATERPAAASPAAGVGVSVTVLLTGEQWEWVVSEAARRGIAQRYVLLSAVDRHRKAIADHFRTTVQEGANLFRWTGEPKDVEGKKVGRPMRIPSGEREILQQLVDEVGAPSLSMYLRIAADIEMREQGLQ